MATPVGTSAQSSTEANNETLRRLVNEAISHASNHQTAAALFSEPEAIIQELKVAAYWSRLGENLLRLQKLL